MRPSGSSICLYSRDNQPYEMYYWIKHYMLDKKHPSSGERLGGFGCRASLANRAETTSVGNTLGYPQPARWQIVSQRALSKHMTGYPYAFRPAPSPSIALLQHSRYFHNTRSQLSISINMAMTEHRTSWECPYCSRVLPSRDCIKKHLEPDKVCAQLVVASSQLTSNSDLFSIFWASFNKLSSFQAANKLRTTKSVPPLPTKKMQ
jgi:hypothetical protein